MITTRYNWKVDRRRKVLFNEYGKILREGPAWYFRGSYFDPDWAQVLLESPLGPTGSLQSADRGRRVLHTPLRAGLPAKMVSPAIQGRGLHVLPCGRVRRNALRLGESCRLLSPGFLFISSFRACRGLFKRVSTRRWIPSLALFEPPENSIPVPPQSDAVPIEFLG